MPPQATSLLVLLVSRRGELVTREEIHEHIWGATVVDFEQGVHNAVRQIRQALGETAETPFVETVPRRGYRFLVPCQEVAEATLEMPRGATEFPGRWWVIGISAAMLLGLVGAVVTAGPAPRAKRPPLDYLKARHLLEQGSSLGAERAVPLFESAISLAPDATQTHSGLSWAILHSRDPVLRLERARQAADEALRLDPDNAEAHAAQGDIALYHDWDAASAVAALDRAVASAPNDAAILLARAHARAALGRFDAAIADAERAQRIDPVWVLGHGELGNLYTWARRHAEAVAAWEAKLELDPEDPTARLGRLEGLLAMRRYDEARPLAVEVLRRQGLEALAIVPLLSATGAEIERRYLEGRLVAMERRLAQGQVLNPAIMAYLNARLGLTGAALDWLDRAFEQQLPALIFMPVDPDLDRLRDSPRYQALEQRLRATLHRGA